MTTKTAPKVRAVRVPPSPYVLPVREWDRMSELVRMFAMTGWLKNARVQSMLLISEPGSGKSELLDRFMVNSWLDYASDLTSQGLHPILKLMKAGSVTHIVATEFQKFFSRKSATAAATLGLLCQMMEEGVRTTRIGQQVVEFDGAQGGVIGAITHKTAAEWNKTFLEYGFWSRCAGFEWTMPLDEMRGVMRSISNGDRRDLEPLTIVTPHKKTHVEFPAALSVQFEDFVFKRMMKHTVIRVFQRFRALAMACALLDGRDTVHARDVEKVVAFDPYWSKMVKG